MEWIVAASLGFALALFVAWLAHPPFRQGLEAPKHQFLANVKHYSQGTDQEAEP
jgi:hypothetical protein